MTDLALGRVTNVDAGMLQQKTGRAVEFYERFFVSSFGRNQVRFSGPQCSRVLQNRDLRRKTDLQLLLVCIQRLAGKIDGGLGRLHGYAVLFHVELCITDLDAYLVLQLMFTHLRLAIFEFGAHLIRLCQTIANWNVQGQADALVRRGGVDHLVESAAVAHRIAGLKWRRSLRRIEAKAATCARTVGDSGVYIATDTRASVVGERLQGGQHRVAHGL